MRQAGRYLPEYRRIREQAKNFLALCYTPELAAEVSLQPWRRYGVDGVIVFADILLVADALGQRLWFADGEGPKLEPIRSPYDLAKLDFAGFERRLAPVYETIGRIHDEIDDATALIGFAGAPWTVACYMVEGGGSAQFAATRKWMYSDRESFDRLIAILVEATGQYLEAQVKAGAEVLQIFDTWAGVLPEAQFIRYGIEPTVQIVRRLRRSCPGIPIIGFPRGAGTGARDYVVKTGVDAISLDSAFSLIDAADLTSIAAVQGSLDPLAAVVGGTAMREATNRILDRLPPQAHVFNLGHGLVPETPLEHVAEIVAAVRSWQSNE